METYIVKKKEGKLFLFKKDQEIGQVSLDATWVKEGDEFKGEGIDFVIAVSDEDYNKPPEKQKIFYLIKGPCGHFH